MYGQIKWNPQASTTVQPTEGPDWKSEEIGCRGQTGRMRRPDLKRSDAAARTGRMRKPGFDKIECGSPILKSVDWRSWNCGGSLRLSRLE